MKIKKMMKKEFEISDILNAVSSISKIDRKKSKLAEMQNDTAIEKDISPDNNQAKSYKSDILVLDQMIE